MRSTSQSTWCHLMTTDRQTVFSFFFCCGVVLGPETSHKGDVIPSFCAILVVNVRTWLYRLGFLGLELPRQSRDAQSCRQTLSSLARAAGPHWSGHNTSLMIDSSPPTNAPPKHAATAFASACICYPFLHVSVHREWLNCPTYFGGLHAITIILCSS